jgi:hypothetical protein
LDKEVKNRNRKVRITVGISINLLIATIHIFRLGSYLNGDLYILYYSYASDILIPIAFYFLLCMNDIQIRFLRKWYAKALIVFVLATFTEVMQAFGVYMLGVTFDVLDIIMFGIGVLIAALLDVQVFERLVPGYKISQ